MTGQLKNWVSYATNSSSETTVYDNINNQLKTLTITELKTSKIAIAKAHGDHYEGWLFYFKNADEGDIRDYPAGPNFHAKVFEHDSDVAGYVTAFLSGEPKDNDDPILDPSQAIFAKVTGFHQKSDPAALTVWYMDNIQ